MMVVISDRPSPNVLRLLINRPDKRNAINLEVRQQLLEALANAQADSSIRAIVFGGAGGIFSAGGDLPSMVGLSEVQARERMAHIHTLCKVLAGLPVPVVSAIEGFGAGAGVGLALLGDHIVVGPDTKILFPFMKLGLAPDWGMLRSLPMRIGVAKTRQLLVSDAMLTGVEILQLGLADEFSAEGDVMGMAIARAERMAQLPLVAFARMKQRLQQPSQNLNEELKREEDDQARLLLSADFQEGFAAFGEKRAPDFKQAAWDESE
jgi:2-(1,2-epoxy-1,2-dihydrophenyl)acetyl-CoA isomerase